MKAVLEASGLQHSHLEYIAAHLPLYLPGQVAEAHKASESDAAATSKSDLAYTTQAVKASKSELDGQHNKGAPRRYVAVLS